MEHVNQSKLNNLPVEIKSHIFRNLSLADARNVRLVSSQCRDAVDSFQVSCIELDDRDPQEMKRQLTLRSGKCKIIRSFQTPLSSSSFKYPECIQDINVEDISESHLQTLLQDFCKSLKTFTISFPSDSSFTFGKSAYLLHIPFQHFLKIFKEKHDDIPYAGDYTTPQEIYNAFSRQNYGLANPFESDQIKQIFLRSPQFYLTLDIIRNEPEGRSSLKIRLSIPDLHIRDSFDNYMRITL